MSDPVGVTESTAMRSRHPRRNPVVPPQHGAWAFLALPVVLGMSAADWTPLWLVVAAAWVAAYPLSWALSGLAAGPRPERFRRPAMIWGAVFVPPAVLALWSQPWLWATALVFVPLFGVNLAFARSRRERALANDLVLIAECTLLVPIIVGTSSGAGWAVPLDDMLTREVGVLAAVCALTLAGSTLHVKSLIRERRDPRYAVASRWFALATLGLSVVVAALGPVAGVAWLVPAFGLLAARAFWVPTRSWRPGRIGMVELGCFVVVAAAAAAAGM